MITDTWIDTPTGKTYIVEFDDSARVRAEALWFEDPQTGNSEKDWKIDFYFDLKSKDEEWDSHNMSGVLNHSFRYLSVLHDIPLNEYFDMAVRLMRFWKTVYPTLVPLVKD